MTATTISAGVWTALVTPFNDEGNIDWASLENLIREQIEAKITGLVICGTTGEAPTLSFTEKVQLIKFAADQAAGKISIMAGTGGNDTKSSIELSKAALDAGAQSLLVVTPPYNKPTLNGLTAHFTAIAEACKAPICLYHVPGRTAQRLSAADIAALCKIDRVTAVKEASGDIALFSQCSIATDSILLSGDDLTYLASLSVGGAGCISVASNAYPKEMVQLTKYYFSGDIAKARELNRILFPAYEAMFCETNPSPIKAFLEQRGVIKGHLRLPLVPVTIESRQKVAKVIDNTQVALEQFFQE